jgi:mannose-1-phosphate guanylyltransferase
MTIMLLAAGEGQRLRPYTLETPKPAMTVLDIPMACFALNQCLELEPKKIVVNTYHLPDKTRELFKTQIEKLRKILIKKHPNMSSTELIFSDEKPGGTLLGSAGGMAFAKVNLVGQGDFLVMNADEVILPKDEKILSRMYGYFSVAKPLAMLMTMNHPLVGTQFGGVWTDVKNKVLGFGKQPPENIKSTDDGSLTGLHFIGPMLFSDRIFKYINSQGPSNILYDALTLAITQGESVLAYNIDCDWFETGNPTDYFKTNEELRKKLNAGSSQYLTNLVKTWT